MASRRSTRLSLSGYYDTEGNPTVSYRDSLVNNPVPRHVRFSRETNTQRYRVLRFVPEEPLTTTSSNTSSSNTSNSNTSSSNTSSSNTSSIFSRRNMILMMLLLLSLLSVCLVLLQQKRVLQDEAMNRNKDLQQQMRVLQDEALNRNKDLQQQMRVLQDEALNRNKDLQQQMRVLQDEALNRNNDLQRMRVLQDEALNRNKDLQQQMRVLQDEALNRNKDLQRMRVLQDELLRLQELHKPPLGDTMTNFALESNGARVITELSSETYHAIETCYISVFPVPCVPQDSFKHPNIALQGKRQLTFCWPFAGEGGHLFITLSQAVTISHVTLGHVTKDSTPTGSIQSAPKAFSVYGMNSLEDEGTLLGTFVYDQDGEALQTFKLPDQEKGVFRHVKLQVLSNWGEPNYTCLYDFRVHGTV